MVASVSKTPFTSFFAISFSAAIFSISCDFVIWAAMFRSSSLIRCDRQYLEKASKTCIGDDLHSFCSPPWALPEANFQGSPPTGDGGSSWVDRVVLTGRQSLPV